MFQFYVMEIQQYQDGEFGDLKHFAYDEDLNIARNKAESEYYEVLAEAAVSDCLTHSAILFSSEGVPLLHQCYKHEKKGDEDANS